MSVLSDMAAKLRRAHALMAAYQHGPALSANPAEIIRMPEPKRSIQVAPHKPSDDHRLRVSQL
jgi:hypothetical protein